MSVTRSCSAVFRSAFHRTHAMLIVALCDAVAALTPAQRR